MTNRLRDRIRRLIDSLATVEVGSVDANGYPNIKRMFNIPTEDYRTYYFSTNVSSMRHAQFAANPKACVYFTKRWDGVQLLGEMDILTDHETKARFWHAGDEKYYPAGVDDPDYCIFRFTARSGRHYHALASQSFDISELAR